MLELSDATEISDLWESLPSKAILPTTPDEFFGKSGPTQTAHTKRAYERHYLRCQAIMERKLETHACYMRDCSRIGMGLISPVQLFPREHVWLRLKDNRCYTLEVIRCRRLSENCYECGTIFVLNRSSRQ